MKSKYKVEHIFSVYIIWKGSKAICECRSKHEVYKIKKALEEARVNHNCSDCSEFRNYKNSLCNKCKSRTVSSHFRLKDKK